MDNSNDKDSRPLFQGIDEFERTYAPQELPDDDPERQRAKLDEGISFVQDTTDIEPTSPAPVANIGSSTSSGMATPGFVPGAEGAADNIEEQAPIGIDDVPDDEG